MCSWALESGGSFFHTKLKVRLWHGGLVHGVCEKDVILFLHFLMQWVWGAWRAEPLLHSTSELEFIPLTLFFSHFFLSPIHLLLSKCEIRIFCVPLPDFSGTFRFKMHCIIFGRLPIIFALPIFWHCASWKWFLTRSTCRPEETTVYICVYVYTHTLLRHQI